MRRQAIDVKCCYFVGCGHLQRFPAWVSYLGYCVLGQVALVLLLRLSWGFSPCLSTFSSFGRLGLDACTVGNVSSADWWSSLSVLPFSRPCVSPSYSVSSHSTVCMSSVPIVRTVSLCLSSIVILFIASSPTRFIMLSRNPYFQCLPFYPLLPVGLLPYVYFPPVTGALSPPGKC